MGDGKHYSDKDGPSGTMLPRKSDKSSRRFDKRVLDKVSMTERLKIVITLHDIMAECGEIQIVGFHRFLCRW